uniref:Putative ixodes 26 kDa salivary protein n=1 Tax=Ixodes ricinus TaxID=34613 RepID=A0A0K8R885_IXORI
MRVFLGALVSASLMCCLVAGRRQAEKRGKGKTIITIAYLLDGNEFKEEETARNSTVENWLNSVQEKAQEKLKEEFKMEIKFEITDINITDGDLTHKIKYWSSDRLLHASTYLDHLKTSYKNRVNPDIICVLTNYKMYDEELADYLAYVKHQTLCQTMVPILLTYNSSRVDKVGEFLSELVKKSTTPGNVKKGIRKCNKKNKKVKNIKSRKSMRPSN